MRTGAAAFVIATVLLSPRVTCFAEPAANSNPFKIWKDGTAFAKGEVVGHVSGCEHDGECKLILQAGQRKVALIYNEGERECRNTQAASWVKWDRNVRSGTVIKAYGAYRKAGDIDELTFCDSKEYFIAGGNDSVPVGEYTEKFFDEVGERKAEVYRNQFQEAQKSGQWITHKDEALGYEFSYPATWKVPQSEMGASFSIYYKHVSLTLGFISEDQQAMMGIDYCGAYPKDKRCEIIKTGDIVARVDWGNGGPAFVEIARPTGGTVTFTLKPSSSEARKLFMPILKTFKFVSKKD